MDDLQALLYLFHEAVLTAVIAGFVLGWLGVHIVTRRMVFMAATLTQGAGLGVALAFWAAIFVNLHLPPTLGALVVALAMALALTPSPARLGLSREAVMALLWLTSSAMALLVGGRISQEAHDIHGILFGSGVLVRPEDLRWVAGVGLPVMALMVTTRESMAYAGFDREGARVQGLPVRALDMALLGAITLQVAVTTRAMGALPVFALSVLPAMAALLLAGSSSHTFPLAAALGAAAAFGGFVAALVLDLPVGASQTCTAGLMVLLAIPAAALSRRRTQRRLRAACPSRPPRGAGASRCQRPGAP